MKHLVKVEGLVIVLVTAAYIALTLMAVRLWSDKSGEIVLGFAMFAQAAVRRFFDLVEKQVSQPTTGETK